MILNPKVSLDVSSSLPTLRLYIRVYMYASDVAKGENIDLYRLLCNDRA